MSGLLQVMRLKVASMSAEYRHFYWLDLVVDEAVIMYLTGIVGIVGIVKEQHCICNCTCAMPFCLPTSSINFNVTLNDTHILSMCCFVFMSACLHVRAYIRSHGV